MDETPALNLLRERGILGATEDTFYSTAFISKTQAFYHRHRKTRRYSGGSLLLGKGGDVLYDAFLRGEVNFFSS